MRGIARSMGRGALAHFRRNGPYGRRKRSMRRVVDWFRDYFGGGGEGGQIILVSPLVCWTNGPCAESTATIRAYVVEYVIDACSTERALKGTDHRLKGIG